MTTKITNANITNTGVSAGSYTNTNLTVNAQGQITAASNGTGGGGTPGGSDTQVQYNNAGAFGGISNATTDGTTLSMTSPKVITGINDTNGNELLKVTATASAVNELTLANAATGGNPVLSATGGDTNIGITLTPKGTGGVVFPAGAVGTPAITTTGDTNTGVYFSAADEISFATGGSQRAKIGTADLTITNGNLVIGTSGKGIDFSATPGTGTSELLADYEEGTWTPSIGGTATYTSQRGKYTKIGRAVYFTGIIVINQIGTGSASLVSGLPFTSTSQDSGGGQVSYFNSSSTNIVFSTIYVNDAATTFYIYSLTAAGATTALNAVFANGTQVNFSGMYFV